MIHPVEKYRSQHFNNELKDRIDTFRVSLNILCALVLLIIFAYEDRMDVEDNINWIGIVWLWLTTTWGIIKRYRLAITVLNRRRWCLKELTKKINWSETKRHWEQIPKHLIILIATSQWRPSSDIRDGLIYFLPLTWIHLENKKLLLQARPVDHVVSKLQQLSKHRNLMLGLLMKDFVSAIHVRDKPATDKNSTISSYSVESKMLLSKILNIWTRHTYSH